MTAVMPRTRRRIVLKVKLQEKSSHEATEYTESKKSGRKDRKKEQQKKPPQLALRGL
jgi:hypothetical protein